MQLEDINHRNHTILPPGLAILKVIFILVVHLTVCLFVVVTVHMWNLNVLTQKDIMKLLLIGINQSSWKILIVLLH